MKSKKLKSITHSTSFITRSTTPREWFKYDMDAHSSLLNALIDSYDTADIERFCQNILLFERDYPKVFKTYEYITQDVNDDDEQEQNLNSTISIVLNQMNEENETDEENETNLCTQLETYESPLLIVKQNIMQLKHDLIIWYIGVNERFYVDIWHREEWHNDNDPEPFYLTHTKQLPKKEWIKSILDFSNVHNIIRYIQ